MCSGCKRDVCLVTDIHCGEVICSNCGLVVSEKIQETGPERRSFSLEETGSRSRAELLLSLARHDMGLSTVVGMIDKDASGHGLDASMCQRMGRLRTWDFRTQSYTSMDRNFRQAFCELDRLEDKLGLSDAVVEKAAYIYRKAYERGFTRGRTICGVMAAATYIACRELGCQRTLKDVAAASNDSSRKEITRTYRQLVIGLDIKIPMVDPMKCVIKVANRANLSERTTRYAMSIMDTITRRELSAGKDLMRLAAAVVYMSSASTGEARRQIDVASAAGVTDVTVRNRFKDLKSQIV